MKIEPFEKFTRKYEDWFSINRFAYESEVLALRGMLPQKGRGVEIGVGSARFAAPLGVEFGVEPSTKMRSIAKQKGVKVISGIAEKLPYADEVFDYVLMVTTLCFLDDVDAAFGEAYRILKTGAYFINGFVNKESQLGKIYEMNKQKNVFYRFAEFFSVEEVVLHLKKAGFKDFEFNQTIFHNLPDLNSVEPVKPGYNEGSFVVIKAGKQV